MNLTPMDKAKPEGAAITRADETPIKAGDRRIMCLDGVSPRLSASLLRVGCEGVLSKLSVRDVRILNDAVSYGLSNERFNSSAYSKHKHFKWAIAGIMGRNSQAQIWEAVFPWLLVNAPSLAVRSSPFFRCLRFIMAFHLSDKSISTKHLKAAFKVTTVYMSIIKMKECGLIVSGGKMGHFIPTEKGIELITLVCNELERRENVLKQAINADLSGE